MADLKYGKLKAFHCEKCGSGIELGNGKCAYCHSTVSFRKPPNEKVRVFIELDPETRFYFHQIKLANLEQAPVEYIDTTMLGDMTKSYIHGIRGYNDGTVKLECLMTQDTIFKAKYIEDKMKNKFNVFFEIEGMDSICKMSSDYIRLGMPSISMNELATIDIDIGIHNYDGFINNNIHKVPKGRTCPNCGAELREHFGICDYCGGWVEFDDCFYKVG